LATILAYVNPLVVWIWIGGLVLAIGTAVAVWPTVAERRATVTLPDRAVPAE
jgi:cytochrome c-type biogenesis protein CcmF